MQLVGRFQPGVNGFEFEIVNQRAKAYRLVTLAILALNFFGMGAILMQTIAADAQLIMGAVMLLPGVPAIYYLMNKKHLKSPIIEICFFLIGIFWLITGAWLIAILMVLFSFAGFLSNRKQVIRFSQAGIVYPSFPVKQIGKDEISNVMLKDGMLTIDLKNNKLYQLSNLKNADQIDETVFNKWCVDNF